MSKAVLWISVGLASWGGCIAGALSVANVQLGSSHSICGPWGCGPPPQALAACHLAWLVGLIPPVVLLGRSPKVSSRLTRSIGGGGVFLALAALLALVIHQRLVWWPQASEWQRPYFWHRYGFTIATAVDFPIIQTLFLGVWMIGKRRLNQFFAPGSGAASDFAAESSSAAGSAPPISSAARSSVPQPGGATENSETTKTERISLKSRENVPT